MMRIKKDTILIIDDMKSNVDILLSFLIDDYEVSVAMDGHSGVDLAKKVKPDLILLDIVLPDIDGFEVCRRIKSDIQTSDIPVIFITYLSQEVNEAHGLKLGAVDYIAKPFSPDLVKSRIKNHLELIRHKRRLESMVEERTRELKKAQYASIKCMGIMAEIRDFGTASHVNRTEKYVMLLAQQLNLINSPGRTLSCDDLKLLSMAAPLHDIGKIGIPDSILLKPGKLTDQEFEEIKKHVDYGKEILKKAEENLGEIPFIQMAIEVVSNHHEKWDGSGYPAGLKGEEIPISARIMALADVYDALRSVRPYKDAYSHNKAISIILKGSGSHFDPVLVFIFLRAEKTFKRISQIVNNELDT